MTVNEFLERYDKGDHFNEDELRDLYWGDIEAEPGEIIEECDEEEDEKRRWSQFIYKFIKMNDRYFCFTADIGLTEYQDNSYDFQPVEVKPVEKIVVITEWHEV